MAVASTVKTRDLVKLNNNSIPTAPTNHSRVLCNGFLVADDRHERCVLLPWVFKILGLELRQSTDSKSTRLNAALGGGKATHMAAFK
jgi:hypothetical protein